MYLEMEKDEEYFKEGAEWLILSVQGNFLYRYFSSLKLAEAFPFLFLGHTFGNTNFSKESLECSQWSEALYATDEEITLASPGNSG